MGKHIAWHDGIGVCITTLAEGGRLPDEAENDWIARIRAKDIPANAGTPIIVGDAEIPKTKFFDALAIVSGNLTVDVTKARAAVLASVRAERDKRLSASDAKKMQADDIGTPAGKKSIAAYRQSLRDLPTKVAADIAVMSLDSLEAYEAPFPADVLP